MMNPFTQYIVGGDEGVELIKGMQLPELGGVWNDQPWFYSMLINFIEKVGGSVAQPHAVMRFLSVLAAVGILWIITNLVPTRNQAYLRIFAALLWIAWPWASIMSFSATPDVLVLFLSFAAIYLSICGEAAASLRSWKYLGSGLVYALACHTKFTALLYLPAILISFIFSKVICDPSGNRSWTRQRMIKIAIAFLYWAAGFGFMFGAITLMSPSWNINLLWGSHARASISTEVDAPAYAFSIVELIGNWEAFSLGILGFAVLFGRGDWLLLSVSTISVCVPLAIHLNHKPWWSWYTLHFAPGLILLALFGVNRIIEWNDRSKTVASRCSLIALALLLSLVGTEVSSRLWREDERDTWESSSGIVDMIKTLTPRPKRMFTQDYLVSYYSKTPVLPNLAVLTFKRFWSGDINEMQVWKVVSEAVPDVIVLRHFQYDEVNVEARKWIDANYSASFKDGKRVLLVRNEVYMKTKR